MVLRSDVLPRVLPVILSASTNLNTAGFDPGNTMIYICNAAGIVLTLPGSIAGGADYARYKGKIIHVVASTANVVSVAQENTTAGTLSGAVYALAGATGKINGLGSATLVPASGWTTLVCDGSTGWLIFGSDS